MAQQVDSFDFGKQSAKYNWDEYMDGNIWRLQHGTDFTAKPSSVIASARKYASKNNKTLQIRTDGEDVVLQAT